MASLVSTKTAQPVSLLIYSPFPEWERQLRSRLCHLPLQFHSRNDSPSSIKQNSRSELLSNRDFLALSAYPLAVIDFQPEFRVALEWLEWLDHFASGALTLALDPRRLPDLPEIARELGASQIWSGPAPPPLVAETLTRWARLSQRRAASSGWLEAIAETTEDDLDLLKTDC